MATRDEIIGAICEAVASLQTDVDESKARIAGTIASGLKSLVESHAGDATRHVTSAERTAWNGKTARIEGIGFPTAEHLDLSLWRSGKVSFGGGAVVAPHSGWLMVRLGELTAHDFLNVSVRLPTAGGEVIVYEDRLRNDTEAYDNQPMSALCLTVPVPKGAFVWIDFNESAANRTNYGSTATVRFFKAANA